MKVTVSFDFGGKELVSPCDIKVAVNGETTLGEIWMLPDIRSVIADGIEPVLGHLGMSKRSIEWQKERIMLSGKLMESVKYPYRYDPDNHDITDCRSGAKYLVTDFLEGRLPGQSPKVGD